MGKQNKGMGIPNPQVNIDTNIKFSFRYYDTSCSKYCISEWGKEAISFALKRLQDISTKKFKEIVGNRVYHFFPVYWEQTIKKGGFPTQEANRLDAYHFALVGLNNQKARVYGAYAEGTFYIIWFDFNHEIWPTFPRNS